MLFPVLGTGGVLGRIVASKFLLMERSAPSHLTESPETRQQMQPRAPLQDCTDKHL